MGPSGTLNLATAIGPVNHCSAYALTYVFAPSPREEIWAIGSDDRVRLWLNGQPLYERTSPSNARPDYARVRLTLRAVGTPCWPGSRISRVITISSCEATPARSRTGALRG